MPVTPSRFAPLAVLAPGEVVYYPEPKEAFAAVNWLRKYHPRRDEVFFKVRQHKAMPGRWLTCYDVKPA